MNARREFLINQEVEKIQQRLGAVAIGTTHRTDRLIAKSFLMKGWFTWNGRFCEPKVKHIGLGVYDCSITEK